MVFLPIALFLLFLNAAEGFAQAVLFFFRFWSGGLSNVLRGLSDLFELFMVRRLKRLRRGGCPDLIRSLAGKFLGYFFQLFRNFARRGLLEFPYQTFILTPLQ